MGNERGLETLSKTQIKKIGEITNLRLRTAFELCLVLSGAKPGDFLRRNVPKSSKIAFLIKKIPDIGIYERKEMIFFYNPKILHSSILEELKSLESINPNEELIVNKNRFNRTTRLFGRVFGYPNCCIDAYLENKTLKSYKRATEHLWCSEVCEKSKEIQKKYLQVLNRYMPNKKKDLLHFGSL